MIFHHLQRHRNLFPVILIFLTLVLGFFIAWSFFNKQNVASTKNLVENTPVVTEQMYQVAVKELLGDFWSNYNSATNDASRLLLVENTENSLLALFLPAVSRSVHFELVSGLELVRRGLAGDTEAKVQGEARLKAVFQNNLWLSTK